MTPEEWERRRKEGLCYRCGKSGHYGPNCPTRGVTGHAIFMVEGKEFEEEFKEDGEVVEEGSMDDIESENDQVTQELLGEI